jgi:hypothetical protein
LNNLHHGYNRPRRVLNKGKNLTTTEEDKTNGKGRKYASRPMRVDVLRQLEKDTYITTMSAIENAYIANVDARSITALEYVHVLGSGKRRKRERES